MKPTSKDVDVDEIIKKFQKEILQGKYGKKSRKLTRKALLKQEKKKPKPSIIHAAKLLDSLR